MIRSMTGFGRYLFEEQGWTQVWEIKSINSKLLDIKWHLPQSMRSFEVPFEKLVKQYASRGRLDIYLTLQSSSDFDKKLFFDKQQASSMLQILEDFAESRGDTYTADYNRFLTSPSLWNSLVDEQEDILGLDLQRGLELALEDWNESRYAEGKELYKDIVARLDEMESWLFLLEELAPEVKKERVSLLHERLNTALQYASRQEDLSIDEGRFLQEVVILADRLDITEEIVRLRSHFLRLREILKSAKEVGRKLDFTLQECFREITTCGNKVQNINASRIVVDFKNELEKCREQVQNLE